MTSINSTNIDVHSDSENENMGEGMYLDAMNQLKEINDKREKESNKQKEELMELRKELLSAYGIVRLIL